MSAAREQYDVMMCGPLSNRRPYLRIPFGCEKRPLSDATCPSCGVERGKVHISIVCEIEECPRCHGLLNGTWNEETSESEDDCGCGCGKPEDA